MPRSPLLSLSTYRSNRNRACVRNRRQHFRPSIDLLEQRELLDAAGEHFVAHAYKDLLGRAAEPAAISYWSGVLDQGHPRIEVSKGIIASEEGGNYFVERLYETLLYREADPAGIEFYAQALKGGAAFEEVMAQVAGSVEYFQKRTNLTTEGLVIALYGDLLDREPDPVGESQWVELLNHGTTRSQAALDIFRSPEGRQEAVGILYKTLLSRDPDVNGISYWAGVLDAGVPLQLAFAGFVASPEYDVFPPLLQSNNYALDFDGQNDFLAANHSFVFDQIEAKGQLTIEAWINVRDWDNGWFPITDKYESLIDFGWVFQLNSSLGLVFNASATDFIVAPFAPELNTWYHVAVSYDAAHGQAVFYVNGLSIKVINQQSLPNLQDTFGEPLYIGYSPSGGDEYANGLIDEVRIWNTVRTSAQIEDTYIHKQIDPVPANLVAYYPFDDSPLPTGLFADFSHTDNPAREGKDPTTFPKRVEIPKT